MSVAGIALAVALPVLPASAPDCFGGLMCSIPLDRADHSTEWPFAIDAGELSCVRVGGERAVFFAEKLPPEEQGEIGNMKLERMVAVTTNPFALLATVEDRALYAPFDGLETLIKRLAPFEKIGLGICPKQQDSIPEDSIPEDKDL